ncbi:preprotein translocase subunit SecB [Bacteroidales bacterium Barb4]|nr:preprotein translocase subunit SecB [Bacteroidales bacterium Barb4]
MENTNKLESGFQINKIMLVESSFSRKNHVELETYITNINIEVGVNVDGMVVTVEEEISVEQKVQEIEQVKIKVKMVGIFECTGDSPIKDLDVFGKVNGAAIIFPYIREHITNLSLKSGLRAIILPPVNFTKNK